MLFVALATVFGLSFMACGSKAETPEENQNNQNSEATQGNDNSSIGQPSSSQNTPENGSQQ